METTTPSEYFRKLAAMRKTRRGNECAEGGARPGAGRPRSDAPRCPCGAMTAKRAAARAHKCERV